jgi:hypothetical protein
MAPNSWNLVESGGFEKMRPISKKSKNQSISGTLEV